MAKNVFSENKSSFGLNPDLYINYQIVGSWKEANYLLNNPEYFKQCLNKGLRSYCHVYRKEVIKNLKTGGASLAWEPLKDSSYKKFKGKNSVNSSLLRFTDLYLNSIKLIKSGGNWTVGVEKGIPNLQMESLGRGGLEVHEYAGVLERGYEGIPARPLWGPTYVNMGGPTTIRKFVAQAFRDKLKGIRLNLNPYFTIKKIKK